MTGSDRRGGALAIVRWFDAYAGHEEPLQPGDDMRVDWVRVLPFAFLHLGCLGVVWAGWSWTAVGVAAGLYFVRMFAITGLYHRYFSHRAFRASRAWQLVFAVLGATAVQRGPLWWAAHHRHHHRHSDETPDVHSPVQHGFLWSHVGWLTSKAAFRTDLDRVPDLARFPELRFLDRFDIVVPVAFAATLFAAGVALETWAPGLGVTGWQMLVWGFFISTVVLFHATCSINSVAHVIGRRRFETDDASGNSFWLALITLGEGWHNNHHRYPGVARQGHRWWEVDVTYYLLVVLSWLGVVRDLRPLPAEARP